MRSIKGSAALDCKNCGEKFDADYWSIINCADTPEVKDAACGGELNLVMCPHCGAMFHHEADFVYIDTALSLLVFVFAESSKAREKEIKTKMQADFDVIKTNFSKLDIPSEPQYVFGLAELKELLDKAEEHKNESDAVAASAAVNGLKVIPLNAVYAREKGYPLYVPAASKPEEKDFLASSEKLAAGGLNSMLLNRFIEDLKTKKTGVIKFL